MCRSLLICLESTLKSSFLLQILFGVCGLTSCSSALRTQLYRMPLNNSLIIFFRDRDRERRNRSRDRERDNRDRSRERTRRSR